jgi:hypothetical protein
LISLGKRRTKHYGECKNLFLALQRDSLLVHHRAQHNDRKSVRELRFLRGIPAAALTGVPLIFEELPDGSQRLVRDDGKHLQWHRRVDEEIADPDQPISLCDESSGLLGEGRWVPIERPLPQDDEAS